MREVFESGPIVAARGTLERGRSGAKATGIQTIYPDGRCELIAHFTNPPRAYDSVRGWHQQSSQLFAAQHRTAIRLMSQTEVDCVGVRLRPAASAALAGAQLAQLRDRTVDLNEIHPEFAAHLKVEGSAK